MCLIVPIESSVELLQVYAGLETCQLDLQQTGHGDVLRMGQAIRIQDFSPDVLARADLLMREGGGYGVGIGEILPHNDVLLSRVLLELREELPFPRSSPSGRFSFPSDPR